jgi:hypothetical protein
MSEGNEFSTGMMLGVLLGVMLVIVIYMSINLCIFGTVSPIILSSDTAKDICKLVTNSSLAEPSAPEGKLICTLPTYDHTQNIIIKNNDKEVK